MGRILLGTSGWSYDDWIGKLYLDKKQPKLTYYSRIFPTVEVDSTFYAYPGRGLVLGWARHTPTDFVFTAKIPKLITHAKRLDVSKGADEDLKRFCDLLEPLLSRGKLGPLLIQCPPSFTYSPSSLEGFFKALPEGFEYAIEFRNTSWIRDETFSLLSRYGVGYVIVDEPLLPPIVQVTSDFSYIRWHGHGKRVWFDYRYSREELEPWRGRIEEVSRMTKRVYGYFNNHFHGYAVENCLQVLEMMGLITPEQRRVKMRCEAAAQRCGEGALTRFLPTEESGEPTTHPPHSS